MEHRSHKGTVELQSNAAGQPVIAGYGAVFNSNSFDMGFIERVDPGAFTKTLAEADVRALGNHQPDWLLGRAKNGTLRLFVDSIGLGYEIDVNQTDPDGQRAIEKVRRGDMDGSSFSFQTIRDSWDWAQTPAVRTLLEVALVDVGPCTFNAYPRATAEASMRTALEPVAKRIGREVDVLVTAMHAGEIRSLINGKEPNVETRAQTVSVAWGPEDGIGDLMGDCEDAINGAGWQYCVYDVALTLDKIVVYDYIDGQYWVAPITIGDDGEPVVSPPDAWTAVESGWVATSPDEVTERTLSVLASVEQRAGARLSQASKDLVHKAMKSLRDLLGEAETESPEDSEVLDTEQNARRLRDLELRGLELAA